MAWEDTVEILHAHVVPQPAPRGKFRTTMTPPSEEDSAYSCGDLAGEVILAPESIVLFYFGNAFEQVLKTVAGQESPI